MIIYPAMDLIAGNCVRLYQGDFTKETIYHKNPVKLAQKFADDGASWLHVVDLDGSKDPAQRQVELLSDICKSSGLLLQVGGGLRSKQQIDELLKLGVARVMLGSLAVQKKDMVASWLEEFGDEKILLTLDFRLNSDGNAMVATAGWQEDSKCALLDVIAFYMSFGLQKVLCTDISLDGTLAGANLNIYKLLARVFPELEVIASGGVGSLDDIKQLQQAGASGVVVGKAMYEQKFSLREALDVVS